ncbi:MAG: flippase [Deltaproteobacteria bacterium]|nr:flippase [Deltaproteobacteria bacterium]
MLQRFEVLLAYLRSGRLGATLLLGTSGSFIVHLMSLGLLLVLHVILARSLEIDQYGIYVYVLTWINLFTLISKLGFDRVMIRFVAAYRARKEWGKLRGLLRRSSQMVIATSVLIGIVGALIVQLFTKQFIDDLVKTFMIGFLLLPFQAINTLRQGQLIGLKRIVLAKLPMEIFRPMIIMALVVSSNFWIGPLKAAEVMTITVVGAVAVFAVGSYWWLRSMPKEIRNYAVEYPSENWLATALPFLLISGAHRIRNSTDIIMIGAIVGMNEAGIYGAATKVSRLVSFGLGAVNSIVAPLISELYAQQKYQKLRKLISVTAKGIFLVTVIIVMFFLFYGRDILALFNKKFVSGYPAFLILMIGQLGNALAGSVGILMTMTGNQKTASKVIGMSAVANIILNAILVPLFGMIGAAIATASTTILWNIILIRFVWQKLSINPTILPLSFLSKGALTWDN